jgi:hypothetical protein
MAATTQNQAFNALQRITTGVPTRARLKELSLEYVADILGV